MDLTGPTVASSTWIEQASLLGTAHGHIRARASLLRAILGRIKPEQASLGPPCWIDVGHASSTLLGLISLPRRGPILLHATGIEISPRNGSEPECTTSKERR